MGDGQMLYARGKQRGAFRLRGSGRVFAVALSHMRQHKQAIPEMDLALRPEVAD